MPQPAPGSFLSFLLTNRFARLWLLVLAFNISINTLSYFADESQAPMQASSLHNVAQEVCAPAEWNSPFDHQRHQFWSLIGSGIGCLSSFSTLKQCPVGVEQVWINAELASPFSSELLDFESYKPSTHDLSRGPPPSALFFI